MRRNFNLSLPALTDPRVAVRAGLGVLLVANLIAAAFAFHLFDSSPEALNRQLTSAIAQRQAERARLNRSRSIAGKIEKGKSEGQNFLASYMTERRTTYSTILGELNETSKAAGARMLDGTISPLDAIEGSDDLDMMTISVNFEGGYNELVKLVNLLDKSPRFLIIESITVSPRPRGEVLGVNVKLNTFVRDDRDGAL